MKNTRIHHINFSRNIDSVVWEYTILSDTERTKLDRIKFDYSLDYEDQFKYYNMIIISPIEQIHKYTKILDDNMIHYHYHDISQRILRNQFNFKSVELNINSSLIQMYRNFMLQIEQWILENSDLDIVLDLINEFGIENLRDIDKKFLDNYANKPKNSSIFR